ncbi:GNAT family N-acetyltransferase [Candidatus Poribacteria bacterium]|nr:GNAT family N-acetyltransferase [Candidatus Poribacteria bacterium]
METIIRDAEEKDVESIKAIAVEAWESIYDSFRKLMGDEFFNATRSDWKTEKARQVENHFREYPEYVFVTEHKGQVIGFLTYHLVKHKKLGVIGNNAIKPEFQGMGFGTKQHQTALDRFRQAGMKYAEVYTGCDESHAPARAAYEKVGFEPKLYMVTYYAKL